MATRRRHSAFCGTWIALLAIWVQALLPAVHHPASFAQAPVGFWIDHSLCLAPVTAPASPDDKGPAHKLPVCPLCQAVHAIGGFTPPTATPIPITHKVSAFVAAIIVVSFRHNWPRRTGQARAPPMKI